MIAQRAIKIKTKNFKKTGQVSHKFYDRMVFGKVKEMIGGRVQICLTGSAPVSPHILQLLRIAFSCQFIEGYGQTEAFAAEFLTHPSDSTTGHVGGPMAHNEFKLRDVPSMNYFAKDLDEQGRPRPRGEILIRGSNVIPGYFRNKEGTSKTINYEGWLISGDVGAILPGSNALKIIDRVKNIFKLSQGEYIAPYRLEQSYKQARGVLDIFVYGKSTKSVLVAVIVVEGEELKKVSEELNLAQKDQSQEGGFGKILVQNYKLVQAYLERLEEKRIEVGFKKFERVVDVHLTTESFESLGLMTTTFKLKRHLAEQHFRDVLDDLYEGLH